MTAASARRKSPPARANARGRPPKAELNASALDTRNRILQAAATAFHTLGFDGASVKNVAERVGITPAALYWHFKSKQDILYALLEDKMQDFVEFVLAASGQDEDPSRQLELIAAAHARWQLSQQHILGFIGTTHSISILASGLTTRQRNVLETWQRKYLERLAEILRGGVRLKQFVIEDPTATALMIIAMCDHVTTWFKESGKLDAATVALMHGRYAVRMVSASSRRAP